MLYVDVSIDSLVARASAHSRPEKKLAFAGLEESRGAGVPVKNVVEPFPCVATLLLPLPRKIPSQRWAFPDMTEFQTCGEGLFLFSSLPSSNFFQRRSARVNGPLLSELPRSGFFQNEALVKKGFSRRILNGGTWFRIRFL